MEGAGKGAMLIALSAFLCAAVVAELPYFPESLRAFDRRNARIDLPPGQASPTVLIDRLGLYDDRMVRPLIALCILLIAAAYWKRMIDVQTAVVLSIVSSFLFLPDESADRTALTAVPLLFVIQLDRRRLVTIWLTSVVAALALQTEQWRGMPEPALDFFRHLRVREPCHLHELVHGSADGLLGDRPFSAPAVASGSRAGRLDVRSRSLLVGGGG